MTTTELIQWAMRAQEARERSWSNVTNRYHLTLLQATKDTAPKGHLSPMQHQVDLCYSLNLHSWNEVQEWNYAIENQNPKV